MKLIDFGFAGRIKSEDDEYENPDLQNSLTESIYTPGFGAPEVLAGEPYGKFPILLIDRFLDLFVCCR